MINKRFIVMIGAPGSGKGTQGKLLAQNIGYGYFSMGAVLRQIAAHSDERSAEIKTLIDSGKVIPDEMIKEIFLDQLEKFSAHESVVIDGFPRDIDQVNILNDALKQHDVKRLCVVYLNVPREILIERIQERNEEASVKRADDKASIISTRFVEYDQKTFPLIEYFKKQGVLIEVSGNRSIEEVHQNILHEVTKTFDSHTNV